MRLLKCFFVIFTMYFSVLYVYAENYSLNSYKNYSAKNYENNEKILFVLDFSNSMNEIVDNDSKVNLMISTMKQLLPSIDPKTSIGLRVYGYKMGFTPFEACRASSLFVPIMQNNNISVMQEMSNIKPKGMTPITYSLKQAVKYDFIGFSGKKRIILLSDGGENCDESPCDYVMELIKTRDDIIIDVIAFNVSDKDDIDQLQCTALVTRGKFYNAETAAELVKGLNDSLNVKKSVDAKIIINK